MKRLLSAVLVSLALSASDVRPDEAKPPPAPPPGFEATGEVEKCVHSYDIDETRVLDAESILFRVHVNRYYVNRLTRACPGLAIERKFRYTLRGVNDLCNGDIITVLDGTGTGAGCILGTFEGLRKQETKAKP